MYWQDKYKRALADGENVRRRLLKQIEDAKSFAIQGFCKDLLDVSFLLNSLFKALKERAAKAYCVARKELGRN